MRYKLTKHYAVMPAAHLLRGIALVLCFFFATSAIASEVDLKVSSAFINVHSGPGSEFPIFHVLSQGEIFTLKKERTTWYKVSTKRNIEGWINAKYLAHTELVDGSKVTIGSSSFDDYLERNWEVTAQAGATGCTGALVIAAAAVPGGHRPGIHAGYGYPPSGDHHSQDCAEAVAAGAAAAAVSANKKVQAMAEQMSQMTRAHEAQQGLQAEQLARMQKQVQDVMQAQKQQAEAVAGAGAGAGGEDQGAGAAAPVAAGGANVDAPGPGLDEGDTGGAISPDAANI